MNSSASTVSSSSNRPLLVVLVLAVLINIAGIGIKFFTDDPGLYAILARTMAQTNNFSDLMYHGRDWLDKPHFPFWVIAISFKVLGYNTVAYKLPALLFFFMSVVYTFKLAKKFYGQETALIAILILLTAQQVLISNTDVRAEPYIMGLLMGSVYHFYKVNERFRLTDMLLASLFAACAVMTKGIYLLIPIGCAIIGDCLLKKDYKSLLNWKWLLAIILVCLFILPEIYTLYTQFDLHPEKVVFNRTGISGIHWFLWDSQFGRFNNNSYIRNSHGSVFFFLHTLLWAYAPWAILFFYALFKNVRQIIKGVTQPEYVCISGGLLMLIIFSVSKFQLPFYTNILFPFFSVITAVFISQLTTGAKFKFFSITQYIISGLLLLVLVLLNIIFAPEYSWVGLLIFAVLGLLTYYSSKTRGPVYQPILLFTCCTVIAVNSWIIAVVYPTMVRYRGDVSSATYINRYYPGLPVFTNVLTNGLDFYLHQPVSTFTNTDTLNTAGFKGRLVLTDESTINQLKNNRIGFTLLQTFWNYPNENLTLPFLIKARRSTALNKWFLIRI